MKILMTIRSLTVVQPNWEGPIGVYGGSGGSVAAPSVHIERFHSSHRFVTPSGLPETSYEAVTAQVPDVSRRLHFSNTGRVDLAVGWRAKFWQTLFLEQTSNRSDTTRWEEAMRSSSSSSNFFVHQTCARLWHRSGTAATPQPHWQHGMTMLFPAPFLQYSEMA